MTRFIVTFDDSIHEGKTPKEAVEQAAAATDIPSGATVFAIDLEEALDKGLVDRFRIGAEYIPLGKVIGA